jgi:phosphate transport system substrate-binding protein
MKNIFPILIACLLCGCTSKEHIKSESKSIQIKGSDTMINLVQAIAEEFAKENPTLNIGITGGGSGTGIAAFLNKTCDIAMMSREMSEKEMNLAKERNINPVIIKIALDGIAVIVNISNPVDKLTLDELRDIYLRKITNWKELGKKDKRIVILARESSSGTYAFFKEHVLRRGNPKGTEEYHPSTLLMPSSQTICNEVMQNPYAIGYVGLGYIYEKNIKPVALAKDKKSPYVKPTIENILNNSYPISRALYLCISDKHRAEAKKFIEFALSPKGQEIVKKMDFVPVKVYEK